MIEDVRLALLTVFDNFRTLRGMQEIYDHHLRIKGEVEPYIAKDLAQTQKNFLDAVESFANKSQQYCKQKK